MFPETAWSPGLSLFKGKPLEGITSGEPCQELLPLSILDEDRGQPDEARGTNPHRAIMFSYALPRPL